ncbi:integrase family protein [Salicola sp. Rm-C-2C1-2]|uniref:tyrosine-type recombinase/integrase n=1 Tax=Salicola sp. Rm-C-2C1-2 TaxID=3141321 RepID=UPI0032E3F5C6
MSEDKPQRKSREQIDCKVKAVQDLKPEANQYTVRFQNMNGFGVRVSPGGRKTFVYEFRINSKVRRINLGVFGGDATLKQAADSYRAYRSKVYSGIDPVEEGKQQEREAITLRDAAEAYKSRDLKDTTREDLRKAMLKLEDWLDTPIREITPAMVEKRHSEMTKEARGSGARANLTMRFLRAVLNHASEHYGYDDGTPFLSYNPVKRLSAAKKWNKVKRRRTFIEPNMLADWWKVVTGGLIGLKNADEIRDCLILSMLTGVRPNEAKDLRWQNVNFKSKTMTFPDTKNHEDHELPITEWLYGMLKGRYKISGANERVFSDSEGNYPKDNRNALKRIDEALETHVIQTDLRRTFITMAESLDVGYYSLKRMLNHTITNDDVTSGYIIPTTERLREPMQRIEDAILRHAGVKSGEVVELRAGA